MRKNILIFGQLYATQFIDISNQYTQLFDPAHYEVTVVYLIGPPVEAIKQRHLAEHVIFLNTPLSSVRHLKLLAIRKMLQLQREKQFQIVICHRYKPAYIMLWVTKYFKVHALFFIMHELHTLRHFFRKWAMSLFWQKNIFFAGVSNAVRDDIRRDLSRLPKEHIITLYNAIDVPETQKKLLSRMKAREQLSLKSSDFIFATLGRLVPAKDHATLIQAFARIQPQCPNAKLIILGDGELKQKLLDLALELRVKDHVALLGFIPQGFQFMTAFDAFVLSSKKEAFGRVLLEAMIAACPIIATRAHGIPEVVSDCGLLARPEDPIQLAEKMLELYQMAPSARAALGAKGQGRALQNFSIPHFKKTFWQLPILNNEAQS